MKISHLPKRGVEFIKEVYLELKKVTWPTRREAFKDTLMVIGVTLGVAFFLGGLDFLFSFLLDKFVI